MILAVQTDYALRSLMYLASKQERTTIDQIATFFGISANHVAKVANLLSRFGYVRSVRGIGGGLELLKPAAEIMIGDVIVTFEGNMHLLECVNTDKSCSIWSICKLKGVLSEAERIQLEYLNSVSLQDVIPDSDEVQTIQLQLD